jgi:outer membrane protein OmpA-like peptidoglycan-associated protein
MIIFVHRFSRCQMLSRCFFLACSALCGQVVALFAFFFALLSLVAVQAQQPASAQPSSSSAPLPSQQEVSGIRFGLYATYNANLHRVQFLQIPRGVPENLTNYRFTTGVGFGFTGGFLAEVPLASWLTFGIRGSAVQHHATLLSVPFESEIGRSDGTGGSAVFRRRMDVQLATAGGELLFGLKPFGEVNFYLGARAEAAFQKTFQQWEYIESPSDGTFETGERTRNQQSGTLPDVRNLNIANFNAALLAGVGYEFVLNPSRSWTIEPSVFASYGLFPVLQGLQGDEYWTLNALRAGIALRYYPERDAAFDAQDFKVKQLIALERQIAQERSKIQAQLQELKQSGLLVKLGEPVGVAVNGQEIPSPTIRVEEFRASNTVQMLNYIFFNENSSVFPARYRRITASERTMFRLDNLARLSPLEVYHHILNIIGKRMTENPAAKITLTGCNANVGQEKGNRRLSRQRADAVSDYLQDVWKIAASRITVVERDLPALPSNNTAEGNAENRRVEITSDTPIILQPVAFDMQFRAVSPPTVQMELDINAGPGLKQWAIEVTQLDGREAKTLKSLEGTAEYPKTFVWSIDEDQSRIPAASGSVEVRLEITDVTNRNADAPLRSIPVEVITINDKQRKRLADKRIDIFTFGIFNDDVAKATTEQTTAMLLQQVKSKIIPTSQVIIEGYVDGDEEQGSLDTFLSDQRAKSIAKALGFAPNAPNVIIKTVAKARGTTLQKVLRNDATLPEGRFYNRSVRVEVQTPLQ